MKPKRKTLTTSVLPVILFVLCSLTFDLCYAFILLSSSSSLASPSSSLLAGNTKLFESGTGNSYQLVSTVVLNEPAERKGKEVGYQISGDVSVGLSWQNDQDKREKLLIFELKKPKLLIQSTKGKTPQTYDVHKSYLDSTKGYPFFAHWKNGRIVNLYVDERETLSLENVKKGIASLFQFQIIDTEIEESDVSGDCLVSYKSIDQQSFSKSKKDCRPLASIRSRGKNSEHIFRGNLTSTRTATYKLSENLMAIESVATYEHHEFVMGIKKEAGASVSVTQHLVKTSDTFNVHTSASSSLENALRDIAKSNELKLRRRDLQLERFSPNCDKEDCSSLPKLLKDNRDYLSSSKLGSFKSAAAFVKLLAAARTATKEELTKAFKGSKNKEIMTQLCDLAGAVQSEESHETIMKIINFDAEKDFEASERYLWALATGSHPRESVIRDIFKISQRTHSNEKLDETIILSLASMANKFHRIPGNDNSTLVKQISDSIIGELDICKDEYCKIKYLRALKNLKWLNSIPIVIKHALKGKAKTSVEALKVIRSFDPFYWTSDVIDMAQRVYFQAGKKFDSSCRTLAIDILLESKPRYEILEELLLSLVQRDPAYEVKRYLVQRVNQIAEKDENFAKQVNSIKKKFAHIFNNYHIAAQRGLTTAFERNFVNSEYRNGTLSTVLEISKGLLKRGIVDVVVESSTASTSIFTLGLFAGGLNSFVSSDDEEKESSEEEEDVATAGMELTVLGSHVRPFIFFSGQGELMGHVWSGTASEKTPAYQAIILVIDYSDSITLQNGFLVQLEALGAASFDLSGQIQISLWNKNAHSLVEKDAGVSLQGGMRIESSFVRSKVEFNVATEMKLNLQSDINFYGGNALCMQLSQPEIVIMHNVHKVERIPGGKHRLRRSKYMKTKIPARTFVLNKKNNEMCNVIFN